MEGEIGLDHHDHEDHGLESEGEIERVIEGGKERERGNGRDRQEEEDRDHNE